MAGEIVAEARAEAANVDSAQLISDETLLYIARVSVLMFALSTSRPSRLRVCVSFLFVPLSITKHAGTLLSGLPGLKVNVQYCSEKRSGVHGFEKKNGP